MPLDPNYDITLEAFSIEEKMKPKYFAFVLNDYNSHMIVMKYRKPFKQSCYFTEHLQDIDCSGYILAVPHMHFQPEMKSDSKRYHHTDQMFVSFHDGTGNGRKDSGYFDITEKKIHELGLDTIDKTLYAEMCLMGHETALTLRPFILKGR